MDSKAVTEVSDQSLKMAASNSMPVLHTQTSETPKPSFKLKINLKKLETLKTGNKMNFGDVVDMRLNQQDCKGRFLNIRSHRYIEGG